MIALAEQEFVEKLDQLQVFRDEWFSAQAGGVRFVIPIAIPLLEKEEADAAREAVLSGWVSQGPQVAAFEREFATLVGAPHACAVSNCTTALHVALIAANIGPGDEVITVKSLLHRDGQLHPILRGNPGLRRYRPVDIQHRPGISGADAITPRTRAIVLVHQMGMPCDLVFAGVRWRSGMAVILIEDAACAAGSEIRFSGHWERIGKPHGDNRLLLLPSTQGDYDRRGWYADHFQSGV